MRFFVGGLLISISCASMAQLKPPAPSGIASTAQEQKKATEGSQTSDRSQHEGAPSIVFNVSTTQGANVQAGSKAQDEKHESPYERITAGSTVALAIITAALALFTAFLWNSTRRLVEDSKRTAQKELRAYIGFENIEPFPDDHLTAVLSVLVRFRNFGKTPASNVDIYVSLDSFDAAGPASGHEFIFGDAIVKGQMIHPTQDYSVWVPVDAMDQTITDAKFNGRSAYVVAKIEYSDIDGNRWRRRVCMRYWPMRPPPHRLTAHHEHNDEQKIEPKT